MLKDTVAKVDLIARSQLLESGSDGASDILAEETGIVTRSGASGSRSETQIQVIHSKQTLILLDSCASVGAHGIERGMLNMGRQPTN